VRTDSRLWNQKAMKIRKAKEEEKSSGKFG
jgi:hypothetical protein